MWNCRPQNVKDSCTNMPLKEEADLKVLKTESVDVWVFWFVFWFLRVFRRIWVKFSSSSSNRCSKLDGSPNCHLSAIIFQAEQTQLHVLGVQWCLPEPSKLQNSAWCSEEELSDGQKMLHLSSLGMAWPSSPACSQRDRLGCAGKSCRTYVVSPCSVWGLGCRGTCWKPFK